MRVAKIKREEQLYRVFNNDTLVRYRLMTDNNLNALKEDRLY